jgi:hypothetical protein
VRVILVSVAVSLFLGIPMGTFVGGLMAGSPLFDIARDIAGVPVLAYAFLTAGIPGVVAGVAGGLMLLALLNRPNWNPPRYLWILLGASAGILVGCVALGPIWLRASTVDSVKWLAMTVSATGACGAVLGLYGSLEKQASR